MTEYKLVPVEPTEGMLKSATAHMRVDALYTPKSVYSTMLSAAPEPAIGAPVVGEPVAWERLATTGWIPVSADDLPHYRRMGQEIRALYPHPDPKHDVAVKALEDVLAELAVQKTPRDVLTRRVYAVLNQIKGGA